MTTNNDNLKPGWQRNHYADKSVAKWHRKPISPELEQFYKEQAELVLNGRSGNPNRKSPYHK